MKRIVPLYQAQNPFHFQADIPNAVLNFRMTSSLCPHLVQEYFERVSDILTTYRPQILKQVDYDKVSENLVIRGTVRQEEHEKIFRYEDAEEQISQMLVVIQNRMWGLENLLAVFMEERISPWLTQEMFRAYMDHLVQPLQKLRDTPTCSCLQMSNSVLYRGWIKALKSLDSWILKAGNSLGFMKQTMYPTENMLSFMCEKLAEYTGGDSMSQSANHDDLVAYGFAPNSSGEVQVAELEEDDINDLISLGQTLALEYHSNPNAEVTEQPEAFQARETVTASKSPETQNEKEVVAKKASPVIAKPVTKKFATQTVKEQEANNPKTSSRHHSVSETPQKAEPESPVNGKLAKQREFIDRLSAPKTPTSTSSASTRTGNPPVSNESRERPRRSSEIQRSLSIPRTKSSSDSASTASTSSPLQSKPVGSSSAATGKTKGFVRSKSMIVPVSLKSRAKQVTNAKPKPTAVTKPNLKNREMSKQGAKLDKKVTEKTVHIKEDKSETTSKPKSNGEGEGSEVPKPVESIKSEPSPPKENATDESTDEYLMELTPEMKSMFLSNSLNLEEQHEKSREFYQLSFEEF